jgi:hypothetical protein
MYLWFMFHDSLVLGCFILYYIISNKLCANNMGVCIFCGEDGLKQPCHLSKALCDLIEFDSDSLGIKNAFLCKSCTLIAKKYDSCFSKENEKFHACKFPVLAIPGSGCCICGQLGANGNRKVSYALKYSQVKIKWLHFISLWPLQGVCIGRNYFWSACIVCNFCYNKLSTYAKFYYELPSGEGFSSIHIQLRTRAKYIKAAKKWHNSCENS